MKKAIVFICILCNISLNVKAQWTLNYQHADEEIKLAVFGKDTVISVCMFGGRIHRSLDGGQSWSFYQTPYEDIGIFDIDMVDNQTGYACGGGNFTNHTKIIFKTTDAGETWNIVNEGSPGGFIFNKIDFINNDTGIVGGDYNNLYRTFDGGQTLQAINPSPDPWNMPIGVFDIYFLSAEKGFIAIDTGDVEGGILGSAILKTTDVGTTWQTVWSGDAGEEINCIYFLNAQYGYAVGLKGVFLKTTDGGESWTKSIIQPMEELHTVCFTDENTGYMDKGGIVCKTTDGGLTWNMQQMQNPAIVTDIVFSNDAKTGYLIGGNNLYKTTSGGDIPNGINNVADKIHLSVFPNPATDYMNISYDEKTKVRSICISDIDGKKIMDYDKSEKKIQVSSLSFGIYLLQIETDKGTAIKKFIKK